MRKLSKDWKHLAPSTQTSPASRRRFNSLNRQVHATGLRSILPSWRMSGIQLSAQGDWSLDRDRAFCPCGTDRRPRRAPAGDSPPRRGHETQTSTGIPARHLPNRWIALKHFDFPIVLSGAISVSTAWTLVVRPAIDRPLQATCRYPRPSAWPR